MARIPLEFEHLVKWSQNHLESIITWWDDLDGNVFGTISKIRGALGGATYAEGRTVWEAAVEFAQTDIGRGIVAATRGEDFPEIDFDTGIINPTGGGERYFVHIYVNFNGTPCSQWLWVNDYRDRDEMLATAQKAVNLCITNYPLIADKFPGGYDGDIYYDIIAIKAVY